ncbi:hypothetical protein [Hyalangium minutum]|uniref:TolB protein protein n=1 Tax=Hyalangium minutum TaxID=394096 RepID=A0A085WPK2_9BACT|nr:hypothetical protein [Hyalangium minutum]KFE69615.1 hypothetical protein DB31_6590 [Hyalangium minutum]
MHSLRRPPRGSPLLALVLLLASGCAFVSPRFSQEVQASFARDDMRKLTTRSMELYYPEHLKPAALRVAARVEACVDRLRDLSWSKRPRNRLLIYMTSAGFNNAYVQPDLVSTPQQMVMPSHMSLELFNLMDLGETELGDVGCHEAVHYVQMQQEEGLWWGINFTTGGILQPNIFTESWFLEGLATYYEGHFDKQTGRPHSPIWRGTFEAMAQAHGGDLNAGHLSPEHREADPFGGSYLTGSHFIAWLVRTYGEKKLWMLIHEQGQSWAPPFGVTLRFRRVYGKSIGALFDDFTASLTQELARRERPSSQAVLVKDAGYFSRLAASPSDGAMALLFAGREETPHLTVRERDGSVRFSKDLTLLLPGRKWIVSTPSAMSGLSFTRDGSLLYLVGADIDSVGAFMSRVWRVDARTGEVLQTWEISDGLGGSVTPDGKGYVFVDVKNGDIANLVRLNLETGQQEPLTRFENHVSLGAPAVSPDGQRVVFAMRGPDGWDLALRGQDGSVRWLTRDGKFNYSPQWVDDDQVLFLREHEERLQAHLLKLSTGELARVTDAPHLVMDAQPVGNGQIAFLNRDGFNFSLDRAPLVAMETSAPQPVAAPAPAPAAPPAPEVAAPPETPPSESAASPAEGFAEYPSPPAPSDSATEAPAPEAPAPPAPPTTDAAPSSPPPASATGPLAEAPIAEPPPQTSKEVEVLSDAPYSPLERLAYPELRVPFVLAYVDEDTEELRVQGLISLAGQDRLGFHAWAINASYDSGAKNTTLSLNYGNAQLAPWYLLTTVGYSKDDDQRDIQAFLSASRTFWTTPVSFGLFGMRRLYNRRDDDGLPVRTSLFGPEISTAYFAGAGTPYGGPQKGLGFSLSAGVFPRAFESTSTMGDVRAEVETYLGGLPFLKRDNLHLSVAGRFLPGAPTTLLEVGGITSGNPLYLSEPGRGPSIPRQYQPGTSFTEYLRGYEDFSVLARHAVVGNALYKYRFIVDYGWASTVYLLPSLFVNQFEVEGFGSWARTDFRQNLRAAGGAARLQLTLGGLVSLGLYYQYAQRFDRGLGPLHLVGLSL